MKPFGFLSTLFHASPPTDWNDPVTGHRILRLSGYGGGTTPYFHQNSFTPKGNTFTFDSDEGIMAVDISTLGVGPIKSELVVPDAQALAAAWRTPDVYYNRGGALYAFNLETKTTRKLGEAGTVINADETLVANIVEDPDAGAKVKELGLPTLPTAELVSRDEPPGMHKPGGRSLALAITDIRTGISKKIHYSTEWLNHLQASPADPERLLFCHEGAWHQVDRIWTIRTDGQDLKLMHRRTMRYEIAGHEFFSYDGKWIWYDLQTPRSQEFWLAGVNIESGERIRYPIAREHWSVHYTISRDGTLFAGDGGGQGSVAHLTPLPERKALKQRFNAQAIFLFTPHGQRLSVRKLADLSSHDYTLEPNSHITPDKKWVIFTSNMHGTAHVYAVAIAQGQ